MELPIATDYSEEQAQDDLVRALLESPQPLGKPGHSPGSEGDGKKRPVHLGVPAAPAVDADEISPAAFGTSNLPFSTARADLYTGTTNTIYPYRASGKLFFTDGAQSLICSASLIKKGIVVTAAHCVAAFGQNRFYTNVRFVPGYRNGAAPFGNWTAKSVVVLTAYLNGTDPCAQSGVICRDDVAVIALNAQGGAFVGTNTGFYGYSWNGFGFTGNGLTHITQIGYPLCLDNAARMERNDAQGFKSASQSNNTVIGSLMCGGSSGGPWLINFGLPPALTGTTAGTAPTPNSVVGTTSWQSSTTAKQMGASPFLNTNIVTLVNAACSAFPVNC
ncbi:MAG: trypsin-like serine peptidase [Chromatiales bacterium]